MGGETVLYIACGDTDLHIVGLGLRTLLGTTGTGELFKGLMAAVTAGSVGSGQRVLPTVTTLA